LTFVVATAGVGLPLLYPVGHPTVVFVVLQVIALIALVLVAGVGRSRNEAHEQTGAGKGPWRARPWGSTCADSAPPTTADPSR
jgi:hypothetical protein